ncbi:MAG TPA: response regulator [Polyangia bacterium]|jgi:two-component system chemotaxis sensor kinase CheA|nr:response regulator [Polyangia bacterium]
MASDPYKYFRIEARELCAELGKGALDLEHAEGSVDKVAHLLRLAHTLKGAARVVKHIEIADLAHAVEDALEPLRAQPGTGARASVDTVLALVDQIRDALARLAGADAAAAAAASLAGARAPLAAPVAEPPRTLRADLREVDDLLEGLAEAHGQLGGLRRSVGDIERARRLAELLLDQLAAPGRSTAGAGAGAKARSLAEELRGLVSSFEQGLARGIERVDRELLQVRQVAQRLRLLPAAAMFSLLERAARDVATTLGKRVSFETKGADVRLDADVLGTVQGALMQAVRNAVAHGIETESERALAGKPPAGTVRLEIERRGGQVAFRCRDDGRGIDRQAVRRAAAARGLLPAAGAARLSDDALIGLLLRGGITTSASVTAVSGRGIGLDIVREAAERLGGRVAVTSEPGRGTTVEIAAPVSLSSLEALVVEAGACTAAIPLEAIRRVVRLAPGDLARTADGQSMVFDGKVIPFVPLSEPLRAGARVAGAQAGATTAVIVEGASGCAALGVNRLRGAETVVVQPLPAGSGADAVVAGASLDAEGNPRLVLYPEALVAAAARARGLIRPAPRARPPVLVVDDSLTTRMLEQSILELAGYEVDLAVSAEEGLEKAARRRYALFLVDVEMPGMDGFSFVATTQKDPTLRDIPAVLVTSRDAPEDRARGSQVGAKAYIVKTEFDQTELLDRIGKLVARA